MDRSCLDQLMDSFTFLLVIAALRRFPSRIVAYRTATGRNEGRRNVEDIKLSSLNMTSSGDFSDVSLPLQFSSGAEVCRRSTVIIPPQNGAHLNPEVQIVLT